MAIKLGGGSAGADINEYRFFADRGDSFTDSNGFVWLKKGARTLDATTYPDALAFGAAVSKSADYKSENEFSSGNYTNPEGLCVDEDLAWVIGRNGRSPYQHQNYSYQHISSDTNFQGYVPNYQTSDYFLCGLYAKCTNASSSSITNANNNIGAMLSWYSPSQIRLYSYSLVGGSGNDAGKLSSRQDQMLLNNSSGTSLRTDSIFRYDHTARFSMVWDKTSRKLYVMGECSSNGTRKLYVYNLSSYTFGYSGFDLPTSLNASQEIDLGAAYSGTFPSFYSMSGDSTHLYIAYGYGGTKIRKIAKSGNLSFAGGTDLAGTVSDPSTGKGLLWQNTDGTFTTRSHGNTDPIYYRTVNGVPKFLANTYPGNSYNSLYLSEFALNIPAIGEAEPDYRAAKTQYQRIK